MEDEYGALVNGEGRRGNRVVGAVGQTFASHVDKPRSHRKRMGDFLSASSHESGALGLRFVYKED